MNVKTVTIPVTTDGAGDFSTTTPHVSGKFLQMRYVFGTLAATLDLDIVGTTTGTIYVNHDNIPAANATFAYRQPTQDVAGAASLYAAAGEPVEDYIYVNEELTVTVAGGGATASGTIYLLFEG